MLHQNLPSVFDRLFTSAIQLGCRWTLVSSCSIQFKMNTSTILCASPEYYILLENRDIVGFLVLAIVDSCVLVRIGSRKQAPLRATCLGPPFGPSSNASETYCSGACSTTWDFLDFARDVPYTRACLRHSYLFIKSFPISMRQCLIFQSASSALIEVTTNGRLRSRDVSHDFRLD
jgi:hypothetical protein